MATAAPTYDLLVMLDAEAPEETRTRIAAEVQKLLEQGGGSITASHDWGVRRTAYEIGHRASADYRLFQFQGPPTLLETLNRTLRITDGVIRYRIVKLAPGTPPPPEPRAETRAPERASGEAEETQQPEPAAPA